MAARTEPFKTIMPVIRYLRRYITLTHVSDGSLNANSHLHAAFVENMSDELNSRLLLWADDKFVVTKTIDELLTYNFMLPDFCITLNFELHPEKRLLYNTSVRWCD